MKSLSEISRLSDNDIEYLLKENVLISAPPVLKIVELGESTYEYYGQDDAVKRKFMFERNGLHYFLTKNDYEEELMAVIKKAMIERGEDLSDTIALYEGELFLTMGRPEDKKILLERMLLETVSDFKSKIESTDEVMFLTEDAIVGYTYDLIEQFLDVLIGVNDNSWGYRVGLYSSAFESEDKEYVAKDVAWQIEKMKIFKKIQWIKKELEKVIIPPPQQLQENVKINLFKFKGKPAQLVTILKTLMVKDWIEWPTPSGEKNARIALQHFEFVEGYTPSVSSMGQLFQKAKNDENVINDDDVKHFLRFPHRNELKG